MILSLSFSDRPLITGKGGDGLGGGEGGKSSFTFTKGEGGRKVVVPC